MRRAGAHAQMAGRAAVEKSRDARRAGRGNGPARDLLRMPVGARQASLRGAGCQGADRRCGVRQECAPGDAAGGNFFRSFRYGARRPPREAEVDGALLAGIQAIEAGDAARGVDGAAAQVDALRLAGAQAFGALAACARVDREAERGAFRQPPEQRADGAEGVAINPPAPPRQHDHEGQHGRRKCEHARRSPKHVEAISERTSERLGAADERVVCQRGERTQEVRGDAAEVAVGIDQRQDDAAPTREQEGQRSPQNEMPENGARFGEAPARRLAAHDFADAEDDVLKDSQRAERRAIDAAGREGREHNEHAGEGKRRPADQRDGRGDELDRRERVPEGGRQPTGEIDEDRRERGEHRQRDGGSRDSQQSAGVRAHVILKRRMSTFSSSMAPRFIPAASAT